MENIYVQKVLDIRFADPISNLYLNNDLLIYGTMMGRANLYDIKNDKIIVLCELCSENISSISYIQKDNVINVALGDEEILRCKLGSTSNKLKLSSDSKIEDGTQIKKIENVKNYANDIEHSKFCENSIVFLYDDIFFRIQLGVIEETSTRLINIYTDYEIKNIKTSKSYIAQLEVTNYCVPLDFNGKKYVYVEFLNKDERFICVANVGIIETQGLINLVEDEEKKPLNKNIYKHKIEKNYGHISQIKFMNDNIIFIVKNLKECEIRQLNDNFDLLFKVNHIGDEILACYVFYNDAFSTISTHDSNENIKSPSNEIKTQKIIVEKKVVFEEDEIQGTVENMNREKSENYNNKQNDNKLNINKIKIKEKDDYIEKYSLDKYKIYTLDIEGNINIIEKGIIKNLFNLYKLNDICKEHKDKQFFTMGYAYYIKATENYIAISSDNGLYLIRNENVNKSIIEDENEQ